MNEIKLIEGHVYELTDGCVVFNDANGHLTPEIIRRDLTIGPDNPIKPLRAAGG